MPSDQPSRDALATPSPLVAGLSVAVYEDLRRAITDGSLPPGYRLREVPLAQRYGVSTTPIREALRRLEREGLLVIRRNRGAVVPSFDSRSARNLYEVRELLEADAARRAALAPERDFTAVERALDEMARILDEPDQSAFNALDVRFHRTLNDLAGNDVLAELAERVHRQIQSIRARCQVYLAGRPARSHAEHLGIAVAVRAGDAETAEKLVRAHVQNVRAAVLAVLDEGDGTHS